MGCPRTPRRLKMVIRRSLYLTASGLMTGGLAAGLVFSTGVETKESERTAISVRSTRPSDRAASDELLVALNRRRAEGVMCGTLAVPRARPVVRESRLDVMAAAHAEEQVASRQLGHRSRKGLDPEDRARLQGEPGRFLGEAIARGPRTTDEALQAFMASPAHCRTLMNPLASHVGIAMADMDGRGRPVWVVEMSLLE